MSQSFIAVSGIVSNFDAVSGLGQIQTTSGEIYQFHCVEIGNETRLIDVGSHVTCDISPILGGYEATNIATK